MIECIGFIYDGLIMLIGKKLSDNALKGTNILRYVLHGILVPILNFLYWLCFTIEMR